MLGRWQRLLQLRSLGKNDASDLSLRPSKRSEGQLSLTGTLISTPS